MMNLFRREGTAGRSIGQGACSSLRTSHRARYFFTYCSLDPSQPSRRTTGRASRPIWGTAGLAGGEQLSGRCAQITLLRCRIVYV